MTRPVNLDGNYNLRSFLTYSLPVEFLGSNLNLSSGYTYSKIPGLINSDLNVVKTAAVTAGAVLSSNISEDIDFTLSYTGNVNCSRNTLLSGANSDYYNHAAAVRANIAIVDGIVVRSEMTNIVYSGLGAGYDRSFWLWNLSFAKKFLGGEKGELRISVNDVLDQNRSVNRSVTETFVEDTESNVLGRYFLAMLTYTLR